MYILGSHSSMVHAPSGLHPHGWNPSVRSLLYRTLLHLLRDLWEPVLLPLRVPVPRVCHPGDLLLTDLDRDGLFPALRRGLSLVVEVILFFSLNLDVDLNLENFSFSDVCPPPPILKFFFLPKVILFMYKISFSNFYCAFIASIYIVICCILINLIEKNFQKLIFRSFIVSGGSAVYVAAYSIFYFFTKLEIDEFVPTLLYFSYTIIMVITFW